MHHLIQPFFSPVQLHEFGAVDYIVFILTIVVSLGIGIYYALSGGRQRTTSEYLVGNRKMAVLPVAISLLVSFESSIMMLGTPAEIYRYGIQWIWANLGFFCANLLAIKVMVPLIHPLKITSANEVIYPSLHRTQSTMKSKFSTVIAVADPEGRNTLPSFRRNFFLKVLKTHFKVFFFAPPPFEN